MLKKLYDKSELGFALGWIAVYCVFMSVADGISEKLGVKHSVSLIAALLLSLVLLLFIKSNSLWKKYGICKPAVSGRKMLFYVPVAVMMCANLAYGFTFTLPVTQAALYILTMLCVGFIEEVIFRGFLFNAMLKDSRKAAIIVSSLSFGMGHIIRLFNGSGVELTVNILQVIYATAAGFMFVMIYYKTKSLLVCIGAHSVFNALGIFVDESAITLQQRVASCVFLVAVCGLYAVYIALFATKNKKE